MSPEEKDLGYVWDIHEACGEVMEFLRDRSYMNYENDKVLRSAIERKLKIIGEASGRIHKDFREKYPQVAWRKTIGLRNILIHECGDVRQEILYSIATQNVPVLRNQMEQILREHKEL